VLQRAAAVTQSSFDERSAVGARRDPALARRSALAERSVKCGCVSVGWVGGVVRRRSGAGSLSSNAVALPAYAMERAVARRGVRLPQGDAHLTPSDRRLA
jgi:hypothetical protein